MIYDIHNEEIRVNGKCFELEVKRDERLGAWRWKLSSRSTSIKRDGIASRPNLAIQEARNAMFRMAA